ncbi:DUF4260 domain-containing protein [Kribbella sindirgiensis]|uniref:DUF4260 domain-containing protein n=1 Tax=Kribbella sindirgiensis TaxID=1124744 RepID=A0A4R0JF97_9ACTN|nr:DUF4260 domain-containing protein [Kribbella sindirgiensis]TCC43188.1 DUF4260 domain-containing protein [Kribbella sindirgiensis]
MRTDESRGHGWHLLFMARSPWPPLAIFLAAFAVFESLKYGVSAIAAALAFFALPDVARLVGVRPPGLVYQAVHRVWIPLVVLIVYSFGPIAWPPIFTAALGWLTRIAVNGAIAHVRRVLGKRSGAFRGADQFPS